MFSEKRAVIRRRGPGAIDPEPAESAHGSIISRTEDEICRAFQLQRHAQTRQYIFSQWRVKLERRHVRGVTGESALISYNDGSTFSGGPTGEESPVLFLTAGRDLSGDGPVGAW